ncbi:MAG: HD domain-containing protein [Candidatus Pacebacteria bacterium]|nr:HD domain-containing protein [Candidatus Paceibacterota bacterium]
MKKIEKIVNFFFEVGTAKNLLRNHHQVLKQSNDTIASHSFRTAIIGLVLADMEKANKEKVVQMCLLHDVAELRTGDANFINKFYRVENEENAIKEQWDDIPGGKELVRLLSEYNARKTQEAIIAKEADNLDQIFLQREYFSENSYDLKKWHGHIAKNLKTASGRKIAGLAMKTNPLKWLYDFSESKKKANCENFNQKLMKNILLYKYKG